MDTEVDWYKDHQTRESNSKEIEFHNNLELAYKKNSLNANEVQDIKKQLATLSPEEQKERAIAYLRRSVEQGNADGLSGPYSTAAMLQVMREMNMVMSDKDQAFALYESTRQLLEQMSRIGSPDIEIKGSVKPPGIQEKTITEVIRLSRNKAMFLGKMLTDAGIEHKQIPEYELADSNKSQ